jgi:hypothetical protein
VSYERLAKTSITGWKKKTRNLTCRKDITLHSLDLIDSYNLPPMPVYDTIYQSNPPLQTANQRLFDYVQKRVIKERKKGLLFHFLCCKKKKETEKQRGGFSIP